MRQRFLAQPVVSAGLILAVIAAGIWYGCACGPTGQLVAAEAAAEVTPANKEFGLKFKWEGVASCSQSNCHGKGGQPGTARSEYDTWLTLDKHAQAYNLLEDKRSLQIVKNLNRLPNLAAAKPTQETLCLNCHAMAVPAAQQGTKFAMSEGVGCELCHGPAEKWKPVHDRGWGHWTTDQKAQYGFRNLKDLLIRVERCVDCHVGIGDINVNHDLIAAGHPRLNFEYGSFLARIPKHWGEKDKAIADLEARAWYYGQVASARAALELLEHRARSKKAPWPEFAEYDCFACHHELQEPSWRQERGYHGGPPGSFPWGTWYFTLPKALAAVGKGSEVKIPALLDQLRLEMGKPYPNRDKVADQAKAVRGEMAKWLDGLRATPAIPAASFREQVGALATEAAILRSSWDSAAQFQMAVAAVQRATGNLELRKENTTLEKKLAFPKKFDSPRGFNPLQLDAELDKVREQLKR